MPNITYKSCYYLFILQPEKFSHLTPCVYFRRVVSDVTSRELKHATFLSHGRQPEVNISHARTVVFPRFSN